MGWMVHVSQEQEAFFFSLWLAIQWIWVPCPDGKADTA
jgi:hypothetical protein